MKDIDPIRIISKIRNNRLMQFREILGMSVKQFSEYCGIPYTVYNAIENLSKYPSEYRIKKLETATGSDRTILFPEYLKKITRRISVKTVDEPTMLSLGDAPEVMRISDGRTPLDDLEQAELQARMQEVLGTLPDRYRQALELRTEGASLEDVGRLIGGVSKERARQIVMRALRLPRHPSRSAALGEFWRQIRKEQL